MVQQMRQLTIKMVVENKGHAPYQQGINKQYFHCNFSNNFHKEINN